MKQGLGVLVDRVAQDIFAAKSLGDSELSARATKLEAAMNRLVDTTNLLVGKNSTVPVKVALANSHEYLNMTGHTVIAWMWIRQETAAVKAISQTDQLGRSFLEGKRFASRFFFEHELPKTTTQAALLTSLDKTVLEVDEQFF